MSSIKYFISIFGLLFLLWSCEGNHSKKTTLQEKAKTEQKKEKKTDSILNSITIPSGGSESNVDIRAIKTVSQKELIPFLTQYGKENPETHVLISTRFGDIEVELYKDTPLHRANFIRLVKMGYFNSTYFHRVAKDFVIQGGNSDTEATQRIRHKVGSFLIPSEFNKKHLHNRGAFSAAKYSEQNISKASSPFEFFIVLNPKGAHHLDFEHTVFGHVVKGMAVADKIAKVKVDKSEWPKKNIYIHAEVIDWGLPLYKLRATGC